MIISLRADGTAVMLEPSHVYQGSNIVDVYVMAPFPNTTALRIGFTLPNGTSVPATASAPMTYVQDPENNLVVWKYTIAAAITNEAGAASLSITAFTTSTPGNEPSTKGQVIASQSIPFTIEATTLPVLPDVPSQDEWTLVLQYIQQNSANIATLQGQISAIEADVATANDNASEALSTAQNAESIAQQAETTANGFAAEIATANQNASEALDTANQVAADVGQYTAQIAQANANASAAVQTANAAQDTANVAEQSVQEVLEGIANRQQIDNTIYASQGKIFGASAGYIRSGKAINKIVFLGNSMTYHDPESYWEVTDLREMAASKPNSGWISLIQQHLIGIFPNIAVYKANCANWERATAGTRTYSIISGNPVAEVKSSGSVATGFTVDDILDDTVDIIIVQVYENCATPSSATDGVNMATDYLNLYNSLKQKSPNAEIYQYLGFWQEEAKGIAIASILNNVNGVNVHPIYAPACAGGIPVEQFKCQTGDPIYNGSGQQITTVTSTVAGHPNDLGFVLMAMTTLYCLYNEVSLFDCEQIIPYISPTDVSQMNEKTAFGFGYYEAAYTGATFLNYYIVSGQYPLSTITTSLGHCVCKSRIGIQMDKNYIPLRQELINISANDAYSRGVALSANNTVFTDWTQI